MTLTNAIIRIVDTNDETVGTGFVIADDLAITCAHVVDDALRRSKEESHDPPTESSVTFFFYATGDSATATVEPGGWEGWYDPAAADVAILRLDSPVPEEVERLQLGRGTEGKRLDFRSFGFPKVGDRTEAHIDDGRISGLIENNHWLQITSTKIAPGVSGGPVFDTDANQVVGIINHFSKWQNPETGRIEAGDKYGRNLGTNYATSTERLLEIWPPLKAYVQPDPATQQLNAYRAYIDKETKYVTMKGVPLPPDVGQVPLDKVYIKLQAVEKKRADEQRQAEREAVAQVAQNAREADKEQLDLPLSHYEIRQLGEQVYRQGTAYRTDERSEPIAPIEVLKQHQRLVILGAPGAGKSTLLRWLARQTLQVGNPLYSLIPMLVSARDYSTAHIKNPMLKLRDFAFESIPDETLVETLKRADNDGQLLWLVDALDEARGDYGKKVVEQIKHLKGKVVITSRPIGYPSGLDESRFKVFEVLPLVPDNVDKFVSDWFGLLVGDISSPQTWVEDRRRWFKQIINNQPRLKPLVKIPLLLTFLVILASDYNRQTLPENRSGLYYEYIHKLINNWERHREAEILDRGTRILTIAQADNKLIGDKAFKAVLYGFIYLGWQLHRLYYGGHSQEEPKRAYLANMLANHLSTYTPDLVQGRNPQAVAQAVIQFWLEAGLLDIWGETETDSYLIFRHLTFQEYAAACYLAMAWRTNHQAAWRWLKARLHLPTWHEPLLLMSTVPQRLTINDNDIGLYIDIPLGLTRPDREALLDYILNARSAYETELRRDLRLAAVLLGEGGAVSDGLANKVIKRLAWLSRRHLLKKLATWGLIFTLVGESQHIVNTF